MHIEVFSYLVVLANTPFAQIIRTMGYVGWCSVMIALSPVSFRHQWRFRFIYPACGLHVFIVQIYAGLLSVGINISGPVMNLVWSFTTALILISAIHGWINLGKDHV